MKERKRRRIEGGKKIRRRNRGRKKKKEKYKYVKIKVLKKKASSSNICMRNQIDQQKIKIM